MLRDLLRVLAAHPDGLTMTAISQALEITPGLAAGLVQHLVDLGRIQGRMEEGSVCARCRRRNGCWQLNVCPVVYHLTPAGHGLPCPPDLEPG